MTDPTPVAQGLPTLHGMEHLGLGVPSLDEAIDFLCTVIGCELVYRHGPYEFPEGTPDGENFFVRFLGEHPRTRTEIAVLRCGNGSNLELFETTAPGASDRIPRFADAGSTHLSFYVDDMDAAIAHLRAHGVEPSGGIIPGSGPEEGQDATMVKFLAPWGQPLELVSYPYGRAYEATTSARIWQPNRSASWRTRQA